MRTGTEHKKHKRHKKMWNFLVPLVLLVFLPLFYSATPQVTGGSVVLQSARRAIRLDHLFYETARGRTGLPPELTAGVITVSNRKWMREAMTADGHRVRLTITPQGRHFDFSLTATP